MKKVCKIGMLAFVMLAIGTLVACGEEDKKTTGTTETIFMSAKESYEAYVIESGKSMLLESEKAQDEMWDEKIIYCVVNTPTDGIFSTWMEQDGKRTSKKVEFQNFPFDDTGNVKLDFSATNGIPAVWNYSFEESSAVLAGKIVIWAIFKSEDSGKITLHTKFEKLPKGTIVVNDVDNEMKLITLDIGEGKEFIGYDGYDKPIIAIKSEVGKSIKCSVTDMEKAGEYLWYTFPIKKTGIFTAQTNGKYNTNMRAAWFAIDKNGKIINATEEAIEVEQDIDTSSKNFNAKMKANVKEGKILIRVGTEFDFYTLLDIRDGKVNYTLDTKLE